MPAPQTTNSGTSDRPVLLFIRGKNKKGGVSAALEFRNVHWARLTSNLMLLPTI
jgi:hypothetical protein